MFYISIKRPMPITLWLHATFIIIFPNNNNNNMYMKSFKNFHRNHSILLQKKITKCTVVIKKSNGTITLI